MFNRNGARAALAGCTLFLALGAPEAQTNVPTKVLVLTVAGSGFYAHTTSMNAMSTLLTTNAAAWNMTITASTSAANFTLPYLRGFDVVFLNNVTGIGKVITGAAQTAFIQWMQEGGGAIGVHGVLDHGDTWPWFTENLAKTRFTSHTGFCADRNSMVRIDATPTAGLVRAQKPEYASLLAALPTTPWNWCDEWYSFVSNPRNNVDMLMTIDPATFTPNPSMGPDHPVSWTTKLPAGANGKTGKFFYTDRGHDAPSWTDANTKTMIRFAICWARGAQMGATSCTDVPTSAGPLVAGPDRAAFDTEFRDGSLRIDIHAKGPHHVEIFDPSGRSVSSQSGNGADTYVFTGRSAAKTYLLKVRTGFSVQYRRVNVAP